MKNQEKPKRQTPQNRTETTATPRSPQHSKENQQQKQQRQNEQTHAIPEKKQQVTTAMEKTKTHPVTDAEENQTGKNNTSNTGKKETSENTEKMKSSSHKNNGGDVEKIKDPDPTIPEKRHDPVGETESDYSRTRNMPGRKENNLKGEFNDAGDLGEKEEKDTTSEEQQKEEEKEPGSFDPEMDQKEAFGGEKKNTPDAYKNKNGL